MSTTAHASRAFASVFAKTLRAYRLKRGLTQEQVALQAGMNRNHYQLLEHARSDRKTNSPANPQALTLIKLAEVFECDVSDLVEPAVAQYRRVMSQADGW